MLDGGEQRGRPAGVEWEELEVTLRQTMIGRRQRGTAKGAVTNPAVQIRLTVGETRGSVRPWPGPPGLLQRCEMYMK